MVVHTIFPNSPTAAMLRSSGIPVHRDVDRAGAVLAGLRERLLPPPYDELPEAAPAITDPSYDVARGVFADAGIAFPAARTVRTRAELVDAFAATGFPLVLKALGQVHKSDAGGVVLGLADEPAALAAYDDLVTRLHPPAVSVEAMADLSGGVELIVGCVRDRTFGPVVMVGLGGIHAEVLADTAARSHLSRRAGPTPAAVPARRTPADRSPGETPVDVDALAGAISTVSCVAARHPELAELEINPLLAGATGPWRSTPGSSSVSPRSPRRRGGSARRTRTPRRPWPGTPRGRTRVR